MQTRILRLVAVALLISISSLCDAIAQTFQTKCPKSAAQDETFRVEYTISTDKASNFHFPQSGDFTILAGPSTSHYSSTQIVNGKRSSASSITYTYILQANHTGSLSIPRPTISAGGKTLQASAATINITASNSAGKGKQTQQTPKSKDDEDWTDLRSAKPITTGDLFVRCTASKTSISEQEPTLITYKLYARNGIGVEGIVPRKKPDMQGFWTQEIELPRNLPVEYERIGKDPFRVYTFMQYLVFPMQGGKLTIPAVEVDVTALQRPESIDMLDAYFNGGAVYAENFVRKSSAINLEVKALPAPKPENYCDAVGRFSAEGKITTKEPASNDVVNYQITVTGKGNMKLLQAPKIQMPSSFETYDPKTEENYETSTDGVEGSVTFNYTFVPREEGDFEIPTTEFGYFDTDSRTYKTITIPATPLHVKKGTRSREEVEREVAFRNGDIRPDHAESSSSLHITLPGFALVLTLIIVLALLFEWLCRSQVLGHISQKWAKGTHSRNKRLAAAEKAMQAGNASQFYSEINKLLGTMPESAEEAAEIQSRRYAPDAADKEVMKEILTRVGQLLKMCVICLLVTTSMTAAAAPESPVNQDAPVDTEISANQTPSTDQKLSGADSTYNAGNAAFRQEDYATAVLCYARTIWQDPSHDDARFNLALTQARLEDQFAEAPEMFFTTWTRELRTTRSASTWYLWSIALFSAMVVCIVCFRHSQGLQRRLCFYTSLPLLVLAITSTTFALMQDYAYTHNAQAVIISEEAPCYVAAGERSTTAATLHFGALVEITDQRGDHWREILLPDGRKVWTKTEHLQSVVEH